MSWVDTAARLFAGREGQKDTGLSFGSARTALAYADRLSTFSPGSYPFPVGSQNRDGFERNLDVRMRDNWGGEDAVLRLSAVWACVRLLAETISTLPLNIFESRPDGSRRFASDHPLYDLLHHQPNASMTAQSFWEAYLASMLLGGMGYGEKKRIGGRVVAIDLLMPKTVKADGANWKVKDGDKERTVAAADMFPTPAFTLDGIHGLSAVAWGARVFRSAHSADTAAQATFDNGLMPTVGFKMERVISKAQRTEFRQDFQSNVTGAINAGRSPLLEGGMEPFELGIDPGDAQLLESRAWSVEEICRWFRVPPFMVGHSEKSTSWGTGIEQQTIGFLTFALRPWLKRIEMSLRKNVLGDDRSRFHAEFAVEGLLRTDSAARAAFYASGGQNGWLTRNEMRALENLAPVPGGDVLTVQSNLVPIDQLGVVRPPEVAASDALKNWLGLMEKETP